MISCECMQAKSLQSCLTPCDSMDCSPAGSTVCGILQARIHLLQGIVRTQRLNPSLLHWQTDSLPLAPPGKPLITFSSVQFSPVAQLCPTFCDPMDCNTPGLPVHHQLPKLTHIYVHWVGDAIQPSHLVSFPSAPAFNLSASGSFQMSQFFTSGGQSIGVSVQHQSFQWIFKTVFHQDGLVGSPCSPSYFQDLIFSNTAVQKHQFFGAWPSLWSSSHIHTWLLEKP